MNLKNIFDSLKNTLDRCSDLRRYYVYRRIGRQRQKGCKSLMANQILEAKEFYAPYFKIGISSHTFYSDKTGRFYPEYIPDELWYAYIEPYFNPRGLAKSLDSKVLYSRLLSGGGSVVHPKTVAFRINNYWVSENFQPLSVDDVAREARKQTCIFVKEAEDSAGGHGVTFFDCSHPESELKSILENKLGNLVVQAGLTQHSEMARLNPSSINTIRVLSLLTKDSKCKILSSVVRIGRNGSHVDNASSGGITVGVEEDGQLKDMAYDVRGERYYCHPDTKVLFSSVSIPDYDKIKEAVGRIHWELPQFRMLSWDIALDADGKIVLIEVNMHSGQLDFHQLNNGPVFGDLTRDVLKEVFNNKHS